MWRECHGLQACLVAAWVKSGLWLSPDVSNILDIRVVSKQVTKLHGYSHYCLVIALQLAKAVLLANPFQGPWQSCCMRWQFMKPEYSIRIQHKLKRYVS